MRLYQTQKKQIKNINSNVFISTTRDVWNAGIYDQAGHWPEMCIMYTTPDPHDTKFAESMTISAFMKFEEVKQWEETTVEQQRGSIQNPLKKRRPKPSWTWLPQNSVIFREAVEAYYTAISPHLSRLYRNPRRIHVRDIEGL